MNEMYVTCPTTGDRLFAGILPDTAVRRPVGSYFANSICPACGERHRWEAADVSLAIPVTLPPSEVGPLAPDHF